MLPAIALPLCSISTLIGEVDPEASVPKAEIQREVLATGFDVHPPVVMRHLLQVDGSTFGDDRIEHRSSIMEQAVRSGLERSAAVLPNHVAHLSRWLPRG